jgi:hypothetical protein
MYVQELKGGNGWNVWIEPRSSYLLKKSPGFYNFQWERKKEMCRPREGRRANKKPIRGSKKRQNGAAMKNIFPFYYSNSDLFLLPVVGRHAVFFPRIDADSSTVCFLRLEIDKSIHFRIHSLDNR